MTKAILLKHWLWWRMSSPFHLCMFSGSLLHRIYHHKLANLAAQQNQPINSVPLTAPNPGNLAPLAPIPRGTLLPWPTKLLSYVDVFVDDFIGPAQGEQNHLNIHELR